MSDVKDYAPVMDEPGPAPRVLLADKGYDADFILADLEARSVAAVIPAKRNRKVQPAIDGHIHSLRNSSSDASQSSNTADDWPHVTTRPPTASSVSSSSHPSGCGSGILSTPPKTAKIEAEASGEQSKKPEIAETRNSRETMRPKRFLTARLMIASFTRPSTYPPTAPLLPSASCYGSNARTRKYNHPANK